MYLFIYLFIIFLFHRLFFIDNLDNPEWVMLFSLFNCRKIQDSPEIPMRIKIKLTQYRIRFLAFHRRFSNISL